MAAQQEELIADEDLDDLYALLDNGFLAEDVDFEKDLAALVIAESHEANFVVMSVPKFVKLSGDLRDTKIQNSTPVVVVVFEFAAKQLLKRNYIQMYCFGLSMSVQKAVSMISVYLKRVQIFFRKKPCVFTFEDSLQLLQILKYIVEDFSGDAKKFYSDFYGLLLDNLLPSKFEDETVTNILMTEAASHILIHLSGGSDLLLHKSQSMFLQTDI